MVPRSSGRLVPVVVVGILLTAALITAGLAEPQVALVPPPQLLPGQQQPSGSPSMSPSPRPSASPAPSAHAAPPPLPGWISTVVGALCALLIAVVIAALIWYVLRERIQVRGRPIAVDRGPAPHPVARPEMVAALDAGIAQLSDVDSDARSAVIACWVRLEESAAAAGTARRITDTSTDLVLRLLAEHRVSRPVLDRFAEMYRLARYSAGPVDESMRATAVTALSRVRAELAAEPAVTKP